MLKRFIIMLAVCTTVAQAAEYYVATDGVDSNPGTLKQPFATVEKGIGQLKAGDTLLVRGGRYQEEITVNGLKGVGGKRIIIRNYQDEEAVLDGTIPLKPQWQRYKGKILKAKIDRDIWQLFVNDKMMTSARFPNVEVFSPDTWNRTNGWRKIEKLGIKEILRSAGAEVPEGQMSDAESAALARKLPREKIYGTIRDDAGFVPEQALGKRTQSLKGAMALLNIGYWTTDLSDVTDHEPGSGSFRYDPGDIKGRPLIGKYDKSYGSWYFLECALALLDAPGEWYYDKQGKWLYLWPPEGMEADSEVRGKVQSYALRFENCSHVTLDGIGFFGTTLRMDRSSFMVLENAGLLYPSYSKRMLGDKGEIDVTSFNVTGRHRKSKGQPANNIVRNCEIAYADGSGIEMGGPGNLVENCHIHDINYSGMGGSVRLSGTQSVVARRNTIENCGSSETLGVGHGPNILVEFNRVTNCGMLQGDGTTVQVGSQGYEGAKFRYNWAHDTYKRGIRFDGSGGPPNPPGYNAQADHNVTWNCVYQGVIMKGDRNRVYGNTCYDNDGQDILISTNIKKNGINKETKTFNNLADFYGTKGIAGIATHNWNGDDTERSIVKELVRDAANWDFRPRAGSPIIDAGTTFEGIETLYVGKAPDMGAYEFGADEYWIPGHQSPQASIPIPKNGAQDVSCDADLMYLIGYRGVSAKVYFGTSPSELKPLVRLEDPRNIATPKLLKKKTTYYWRVDTILSDGTEVEGDLWRFATGNKNKVVFTPPPKSRKKATAGRRNPYKARYE